VDILQELENQLGKQFKLVSKAVYGNKMGFTVENQQINAIGLYDCSVSSLPESIGNLSSLQKLFLWNNNLKTLPESISNLKSL